MSEYLLYLLWTGKSKWDAWRSASAACLWSAIPPCWELPHCPFRKEHCCTSTRGIKVKYLNMNVCIFVLFQVISRTWLGRPHRWSWSSSVVSQTPRSYMTEQAETSNTASSQQTLDRGWLFQRDRPKKRRDQPHWHLSVSPVKDRKLTWRTEKAG